MSEDLAKAIRIVTLPQVMVFFLILLLGDQIPVWHDGMAIVLLCILPLLSYLYWRITPKLRRQGRKSQRKLAIAFSVVGYVLGTVYCITSNGSQTELFMYLCYVICGALIALSSYAFHIKSSGHAAGGCRPCHDSVSASEPMVPVRAFTDDTRRDQFGQAWPPYTKGTTLRKLLSRCRCIALAAVPQGIRESDGSCVNKEISHQMSGEYGWRSVYWGWYG